MKKYVLLVCVMFTLVGAGYLIFSTWAKCFAGGGGTSIIPAFETHTDKEVRPGLRMFRSAAEGCLTGVTSDTYKDVKCGYRKAGTQGWINGKIEPKMDNVSQYLVECIIPPVGGPVTLEYYFEFTAWKNQPQKVTFSQDIK